MRERLRKLRGADADPAVLVEVGALAVEATAAGEIELAAVARALEAQHARFLGRHQHTLVAGAELLELWPRLRERPVPDEDEDDVKRRAVWGLKYVAGSAMDLPEVSLDTTDAVLATLAEMLDHYGLQPQSLWLARARRAFIVGDEDALRELVARIAPTATRWHYMFQCSDCPGCVYNQLAEWLGEAGSDVEIEEILAPILGKRPFPPDPAMQRVLDLMYGDAGACENAVRNAPMHLARAYVRADRLAEALREAERAVALAEGHGPRAEAEAMVVRTIVANALHRTDEAKALARELVTRAQTIEDVHQRLEAVLAAHDALREPALADEALDLAARLDARLPVPRHVAATQRLLDARA
jgi:tetratricopeptide (TPR) repeat protein